ncbi:VOC family protein [Deinococcus detaillensis]|uniref:hypothetical protein n=1 Tax=Deinococcus detaillensis TaxID=2592048 RepID=UPI00163D4FDA|nr:hypothetical protein [Deinococcus detaillensis]
MTATFPRRSFAHLFGLSAPPNWGPFVSVSLGGDVDLQFSTISGEIQLSPPSGGAERK